MSPIQTESRKALRELLDLLGEIDERWAGPEWNLPSEADVPNAHRALLHILEGGLITFFETDPTRPRFQRIVSATRKITGDNPDAIYYDAPVSPDTLACAAVWAARSRAEGGSSWSFCRSRQVAFG